uniref:Uncharacterized protein n=1 Tax=Oryza meridionalis TaxID=40149 RepID=A0A0E0DS51_9ORYZ
MEKETSCPRNTRNIMLRGPLLVFMSLSTVQGNPRRREEQAMLHWQEKRAVNRGKNGVSEWLVGSRPTGNRSTG